MSLSYDIVKFIIDKWDPVDLLITHAPSDEYDRESQKVFGRIVSIQDISIDEFAMELFTIFTEAFGPDVFTKKINECRVIAERILSHR